MGRPININDTNFEEIVLKAKTPVLVDFWAPWCAPCRMVAPLIEEVAREYAGRMDFAKINVDENPRVSSRYGIRAIPTLLIFKDGKPVDQIVGFIPKAELKEHLEKVLV